MKGFSIKKIFALLALTSLLTSSVFAEDFLAKVSNGVLSDNSQGVKALNLDEMKEVKGGYVFGDYKIFKDRRNLTSEVYAIVDFTQYELENLNKGLCGAGEDKCQNPSRDRLFAWLQVSANSPADYRPVYKVKRQIKYSNLGQPYVLFTYGVAVYNVNNGQIYQYNSSPMLNNNRIIREFAHQYKSVIEDAYWEDFVQKYFGEMLSEEYANKYGYNEDPDVKEVENSLLEQMRKDKLTEEEWEILNGAYDIDNIEFIPRDKIARIREANLLKTLTSASEFARIWVAEKDERKKRFIDALDVKPLTQEEIDRFLNKQQSSNSTQESNESGQNPDEKPFKAIQGESKNKETYKDNNISSEFLKKLLENSFNKAKELELLFGMKFSDDNTGEFNKIISQNTAQKSIDIKA